MNPGITQTPQFIAQAIVDPNRVDFNIQRYEEIIAQKGFSVIIEKCLMCPCKSKSSSHQSSCQNCGGSGLIFTTPRTTRMIIQGINLNTDYKTWSEELRGTIKLSYSATEELAFMDKITLVDGESIFSEVITIDGSNVQDGNICTLGYVPKELLYVGKFNSISTPIIILSEGIDYIIQGNIFTLLTYSSEVDINITLRYKHAPVYHVIDFNRENMPTFVFEQGKEELSNMPISAIARRAHNIANLQNISNNRLVVNPWPTSNNCN